ncbi:hypothetical protein SAMN04490357_2909 [Streptomyces misionensis]|uniref:Bacterial Ig domain-containing protein n=1 Tax=Streptomyces misionensis TaxID=67331 RepID=A0A1H4VD37_9ACTN|nr:hypothetical protein [Streptomyces misionensis]SEC78873.1 hypothetical protein SAMN04490357_2909 [Streptomyces misionensis]
MTSVLRHHRYGRALGTGAITVALLSGGTAAAFAAPTPTPSPTRTGMSTTTPSPMRTRTAPMPTRTERPRATRTETMAPRPTRTVTRGSITVSTREVSVRRGRAVAFTGRVRDVRAGTTLVLQRRVNGHWTTLRTTALVNRNGTFTIRRTFTARGTETVRVVTRDGRVQSAAIVVRVS